MAERSAGILMWRRTGAGVQMLLAHFGGPYWAKKDAGAWGIPKGRIEPGESAEQTARREFHEELSAPAEGRLTPLPAIRQSGGKWVDAFALEGDFDPAALVSNPFSLEWPPRSGTLRDYPEVDRVRWFGFDDAHAMILPSQRPLLTALADLLSP